MYKLNNFTLICRGLYESGPRPEKFLRLMNSDIRLDPNSAVPILRGRTDERRVRIIAFARILEKWLEVHPLRKNIFYPLWISEATNFKNNQLGYSRCAKDN
jgi:hypothetical protein